jgi:GDP/UDP-N,N'-diacetylbacillosamine 2-epimerase (hydrolysing)
MNTLVIHVGGGDPVFGNADDPVRHAVTKLSHVHFTFSKQNKAIVEKLGEESFRVFNIGNPSLDRIRAEKEMSLKELKDALEFDISDGNYVVLIMHPLSSEKDKSFQHMETTLQVLLRLSNEKGLKTIGIFPNTDPGSYQIIKAIKQCEDKTSIKFFRTLERRIFINLIRHCRALVGNSSMGILEAPFLGIPVVNIGNRQRGRIACGNVDFVDLKPTEIRYSIVKACYDEHYREKTKEVTNIYGDGFAGQRAVEILKKIDSSDPLWLIKKLSDS